MLPNPNLFSGGIPNAVAAEIVCLDAAAVVSILDALLVDVLCIVVLRSGGVPGAQTHTHTWSHAPCTLSCLSALAAYRV